MKILFFILFLFQVDEAFSKPVEVLPSDFQGGRQPQIALDSKGRIYIAFGKENSVYCVRSDDGGKTFFAPQKIATLKKLALGMRRGPRIAVLDEQIFITAISHDEGNLYVWSSRDGGNSWTTSVKINDVTASTREGLHALAGDSKEKLFVTWLDLRNKKTELWGTLSTDAGRTWGTNFVVYKSPDGSICECCHPSAVFSSRGEMFVLWRNSLGGYRDMYLAGRRDNGKTFSPALKLGKESWPLKGCPMDGGDLAINADGKPVAVWRRELNILTTENDQAEILLAEQGTQPVVAYANGKSYFIWQEGSKLKLKAGSSTIKVLAEKGAYAVITSGVGNSAPIAVWESSSGGENKIWAEVLK